MNNTEYISELSQRCGYSLDDTQKLVRSVIESMAQRFDDGDGVSVDDFGVFEVKKRNERIVVNPSTGQKMMVPPKIVLALKAAPVVQRMLNDKSRNDKSE